MTNPKSSEAPPNQMIQLSSSISSTLSAPVAPESFNATHVISSSMKLMDSILGYVLILLESGRHGIFHRAYTSFGVILPKDPRDRLPGISAEIFQNETPLPPPFQFPNGRPSSASLI